MFGSTFFVFLMAIISTVNSECPNGCSGHGTCNAYDICTCDAQHQGNDCSERTCAFGKAHSDISKGDINGDGVVSNSDVIVGHNGIVYRYGTTEGFPSMTDSDQTVLQNTAHDYAECSSKGTCDRSTGTCHCFPGYDGVACQRASCPGYPASCSGHGVCKTIKQLAHADYGNIYELWDEDATMGCECDSGYFGADCSLRKCKVGQDPLYEDDVGQRKTAQYFVGIFTTNTTIHDSESLFHDGTVNKLRGSYRYLFTDEYGKKWETATLYENADCTSVVNAFQGIPSDVLPPNAIRCTHLNFKSRSASDIGIDGAQDERLVDAYNGELITANMMSFWSQNYESTDFDINVDRTSPTHPTKVSGDVYVLRFPTISRLPPIEIETYIDGNSNDPTLVSDKTYMTNEDARIIIYSDGQLAETNDWFGDYCVGVQVQIKVDTTIGGYIDYVGGDAEGNKLKTCLGDADGYSTNNVGLQNWDYGTYIFPHLIKITKVSKNTDDDSDYLAIYYNADNQKFMLLNPYVPRDMNSTMMASQVAANLRDYPGQSNNWYNVFTTQGTMKLVSRHSQVVASPGFSIIYTVNATNDYSWLDEYNSNENNDGDVSCENYASGKNLIPDSASHDDMTTGTTFTSCIEKDDWILLLGAINGTDHPVHADSNVPQEEYNNVYKHNPTYINIYKVVETGIRDAMHTKSDRLGGRVDDSPRVGSNASSAFLRNQITLDQSPNFHSTTNTTSFGIAGRREINIYKFFPSTASTYEVMAECSGRGTCDTTTGLCQCFAGYTGDACSIQAVTSC